MAGINDERTIERMSNRQFDAFLETLARLIEARNANTEEAAQIIREAKTNPDR